MDSWVDLRVGALKEQSAVGMEQDTKDGIDRVLGEAWVITNGTVVPETEDITLKNGGRTINATYLYADLANSSQLAQTVQNTIVGKVIRCYLNAATRLLNSFDGKIRSFDGDRVTAVFIGNSKNTNAVKAAFELNWAVRKVIREKLDKKWPKSLSDYTMHHGVGIDTGEALIIRGGVRNHSDLVSIGAAPNVAAKLSELRNSPDIYITDRILSHLNASVKRDLKDTFDIWKKQPDETVAGTAVSVFGADYWRKPGA
jgi:adenylate cyclase